MRLLDRRFRYHNAASHANSDGLRARMRRYAEQVKRNDASRATVTPIKRKAK